MRHGDARQFFGPVAQPHEVLALFALARRGQTAFGEVHRPVEAIVTRRRRVITHLRLTLKDVARVADGTAFAMVNGLV